MKELAEEVVSILQSAGIKAMEKVNYRMYAAKPHSIILEINPSDVELAKGFWTTLHSFINIQASALRKKQIQKGTIELIINDEPSFLPKGIVVFR